MPRIVDIEQRRSELADAAARLIARSGVGAATMRDVAAEAGWTTGALTHYFANKRELLRFTFESSLAGRLADRAGRRSATPQDALTQSLEGALPIDDDRRRHWMVTIALCAEAASDPDLAEVQAHAYREFRRHITGLVGATGVSTGAARIAERLIAAADGIAIQALFDTESWPAGHQRRVLREQLRLVAPEIFSAD